jgi:heavy metal sensor kinase
MKSIRRSLIVYVLVLLTAALAAVSWFSYSATAHSLQKRREDSQRLIQSQCKARSDAVRDELDRRILEQARTMARTARAVVVLSDYQWAFGAIVWVAQDVHPPVPFDVIREIREPKNSFPTLVLIDDDLVAEPGHDRAQEYYQTYLNSNRPIQRSMSLGDEFFTLTEEQKKSRPLAENFDFVELQSGKKLRRVTLKAPVFRLGGSIPTPRLFGGFNRPGGGKGGGKGMNPPKDQMPKDFAKGQPPRDILLQTVFIQYASDVAPTEAKIRELENQCTEQLAELDASIDGDLNQLRMRMAGIGFATLAALWLGGYLVILVGLAPLSKMTEAVSQVSAQNFRLPLDTDKLPDELQPIAARLGETLQQLQKAFDREKQAAADISHELRTPLAALMTTLEVALRKNRSEEEYRDILEECQASGQHMYQLVERLLTLARLDAGADQYRPAQVDVVEVALSCSDIIRPLARARGLELRLNLPDPITTQTDPNKLREVLTNLLHNAVEYNKPNGSIELSIERTNGHVRCEVRDTGIGMKPETLGHLFERFYRADPSRHADTPHAGLGLSIVKSYVDLMGGTIKVDSSDAGSVFTVEIPYVETGLQTAIKAEPELV